MREVTNGFNILGDLKEMQSMEHIKKTHPYQQNTLRGQVSHSNSLSLSPIDDLSLLTQSRSHAIGKTMTGNSKSFS